MLLFMLLCAVELEFALLPARWGRPQTSEVIRIGITEKLVVKHLVIVPIERSELETNYESASERMRCKLGEVWLYQLSCLRHGGIKNFWLASLVIIVGSNINSGLNHPRTMTSLPEVDLITGMSQRPNLLIRANTRTAGLPKEGNFHGNGCSIVMNRRMFMKGTSLKWFRTRPSINCSGWCSGRQGSIAWVPKIPKDGQLIDFIGEL